MLKFLRRTPKTNGEHKGDLDPRLSQLWFDDYGERLKIRRSAIRAADGIHGDTTINNTTTGVTTKQILGSAAFCAACLGGAWYLSKPETTPPAPTPVVAPVDSEYSVIFYDSDGNVIPVERRQP